MEGENVMDVGVGEDGCELQEPIMISALEHYAYCPRQCGLIHLEQTFEENIFTTRGRLAHTRADQQATRQIGETTTLTSVPLWSRKFGLVGRADVVEFRHRIPYPVEYKQTKKRENYSEHIQVCAQALCLEEMFGVPVEYGAIYYHQSRQRQEVACTPSLKTDVERMVSLVRTMLLTMQMPAAVKDRRCTHCSLANACLPHVTVKPKQMERYYQQLFQVNDECVGG